MFEIPSSLLKVKVVAEVVRVCGVLCDTCGGGGDGACLRDDQHREQPVSTEVIQMGN